MADSNQSRRADYSEIADNDPFAELTRIMGHDPRAESAAPAVADAASDDDFAIDLEKELLGELDFAEFDEAQSLDLASEVPADELGDPPVTADNVPEAAAEQSEGVAAPSFEIDHSVDDLAASIMQSFEADEAQLHQREEALHASEAPPTMRSVDMEDASLDEALERELGGWGAASDHGAASVAPELDTETDADFEIAPALDGADVADSVALASADWETLPSGAEEEAQDREPGEEFHASATVDASDEFDGPGSAYEAATLEETFADVANEEPSFHAGEQEAVAPAPAAEPRHIAATADQSRPSLELSLEEELNALLSGSDASAERGDGTADEADLEAAAYEGSEVELDQAPELDLAVDLAAPFDADMPSGSVDETTVAEVESIDDHASGTQVESEPHMTAEGQFEGRPAPKATPAWMPTVNTFGRANFIAARSTPDVGAQVPASPQSVAAPREAIAVASVPAWDEPAEFDASQVAAATPSDGGAEAGAASGVSDAAPQEDVFGAIFADALAQEELSKPVDAASAELDEVLSHFDITAPRAEAVASQSAAGHAEPPAVETIEVADAAYALADDLDIPEVDYGTQTHQAAALDDLHGDFAHAFDDTPPQEPAVSSSRVAASPAWDSSRPFAADSAAATTEPSAAGQAVDPYAVGEGEWQADQIELADDFAFDDEFDQALANSVHQYEAQAEPARARRGVMVAAVVGGIALFGGMGVLAMSLFGGGSEAPAVVRADTDPMKVRPENPGGTVVPNQDSEAYNRVAGGTTDVAPEQERLITTAEEPVDLAAETEPVALPSSIGDGEEVAALAESDPAQTSAASNAAPEADAVPVLPKGEDRIEQTATDEPEGVGASGDLLAVTPRKVRTMIVRPDGTMVPREAPAPAPEETVVAAAPLVAPAAPTVEQAAPIQSEEDAGPTVTTPDTVGVVPSQRAAPQQTTAPAATPEVSSQQPAAQAPAATPVSAPAAAAPAGAATSEWSMQIASQPTAESAQATYQDLARRYGSVLEGKGVNIVRADIAGKGVYYRVRIPASSRDEAIRLCTQYKSAGGSCFVSR